MKKIKSLKYWILLLTLIAFAILTAYIVTSYTQFADSGLSRDLLIGKIYLSPDGASELWFDEISAGYVTGEDRCEFSEWRYTESVVELFGGETVLRFWVIDENTLFGEADRNYLFAE